MKLEVQPSPARVFRLWVVLPAFNEEGSIGPLLDSLLAELGADYPDFTILVVNDGSTDRTAALVRDYESTGRVLLIDQPANRGLAETLRSGTYRSLSFHKSQPKQAPAMPG